MVIIILQTRCQIESQVPGCIYLKSLLALFLSPTLLFIQVIHTYIHSTRLFAQSKIAVKSVLKLRTIFHMELLGEAPQLVFFCIVSCSCTWKKGEWVESAEMFKSWPQQYIYYMYCRMSKRLNFGLYFVLLNENRWVFTWTNQIHEKKLRHYSEKTHLES